MGVVSQGVSCGLLEWQMTVVVSLAPRQIDRGDVGWPYWEDTEAGKGRSCSCWKKETGFALFLNYIIVQLFNICQIYKKSDVLIRVCGWALVRSRVYSRNGLYMHKFPETFRFLLA